MKLNKIIEKKEIDYYNIKIYIVDKNEKTLLKKHGIEFFAIGYTYHIMFYYDTDYEGYCQKVKKIEYEDYR